MAGTSFLRYLKPLLTEQFRSRLAPTEIMRRVQASIAPPTEQKWLSFSSTQPTEPFRGTAGPNGFELQRIIDYRNSMLPRITGRVAPASNGRGSWIVLEHQLHPFTLAFGGLWLFMVGSVAVGVVQSWISSGVFEPFYLVPLGMLAFGVCLLTVPFWLEVRQSRPLLIRLLELEEPPIV